MPHLQKWNFLNFKPGLVGGHCISVDPYYLTYKAKEVGYSPDVILSGRLVNENMADFVAGKLLKTMEKNDIQVRGSKKFLFWELLTKKIVLTQGIQKSLKYTIN